ncbi:MAG: hypothetical protein MZU97_13125 [Bacillus subtilis]|nr:hypothetical protein [Bacillus subtilis]
MDSDNTNGPKTPSPPASPYAIANSPWRSGRQGRRFAFALATPARFWYNGLDIERSD